MSVLAFNVIDNAQGITDILSQIALTDQNSVFPSAYWFRHHVDEHNISFTATDADGVIQQALHLRIYKKLGFTIAETAGQPFSQYSDVINNSGQPADDFFKQALQSLKAKGVDALHLHNVRQDAHIINYCQANGTILEDKQAPWIDLAAYEDYPAYFNSTSKTTRKIYRKFFRDLDVETNTYVDEQITRELVIEVINLKAAQLESQGLSSRVFADADNMQQLIDIFSTPTSDFKTHIGTCRADGKLVAAGVSHVKGQTFYGYIIAMDVDYTRFSPGNSLVLGNIEWAYQNGIAIFDFLAPADHYKFKWTKDNATPAYDVLLPMSAKGRFYGSIYLKKLRPILISAFLYIKNSRLYKTLKK